MQNVAATPVHSHFDTLTVLTEKTSQLAALLANTYGGAHSSFSQLAPEVRDKYLWACADMAYDIERLAESVASKRPVTP